jgi:hypothetical protein
VSVIGVYFSLQMEKKQIRREVKRMLLREEMGDQLVRLAFHVNQIDAAVQWAHDFEFAFAGTMYDIVNKSEQGDSVILECWPDHAESAVNIRLARVSDWLLQGNNPSENEKQLTAFFLKLYCADNRLILPLNTIHFRITRPVLVLQFPFPEMDLDVPPPRIS